MNKSMVVGIGITAVVIAGISSYLYYQSMSSEQMNQTSDEKRQNEFFINASENLGISEKPQEKTEKKTYNITATEQIGIKEP